MQPSLRNPLRDRRIFLQAGLVAAGGALTSRSGLLASPGESAVSANDMISVGIMGVNGRGRSLMKSFAANSGVRVTHLCDVDTRATDRAAQELTDQGAAQPTITGDVRKMLEDKTLDAIVVAAPNHWHAPATIMGCAAGKHVYVEKPCSYTAQEGEWAVAAARKHRRVVQMGSQRRSWPGLIEAIAKLRAGDIGEVLYSRTWYNSRRGSIGTGVAGAVPDWLDWDLWQGPAPRRPFKNNVVHYNWHWHWHWGNGELGNNGIHALDVARWGVDVTYPQRVTAGGGRHRFDDDQETPDTMMVTFDFPEGRTITWEGLSWSPLGPHESRFGISFHGTEGSLVIRDAKYVQFNLQDKPVLEGGGGGGDHVHLEDFLDAIRQGRRPNADILEAHRSTLLCHLGNIAYRTSSVLHTDPGNGAIVNHPEAAALWTREYETGWEPTF